MVDYDDISLEWWNGDAGDRPSGRDNFQEWLDRSHMDDEYQWRCKSGDYVDLRTISTGYLVNIAKVVAKNSGSSLVHHRNYKAITNQLIERGITKLHEWVYTEGES